MRAYITGGSKGIGYGIAEAVLKAGGQVTITARTQSSADQAKKQLENLYSSERIFAVAADVTNYDSEQQAVIQAVDRMGGIDLVVANAGVGKFGSIEELTLDDWHHTLNTNLTGVFHTVKASLAALKASQGTLITISSLAGTNFFAGGSAYNASKFGLTGFTQAVMLDLRKYGIRVSTIMPGSVATYFNDHVPSAADDWKIQIEDIGQLVVDLVRLNPRTLPSKIELRPTMPPSAR